MITRPTRLSDDSNTLIDNIFTNNSGKTHISGILTSPISDHLLNFCILEDIPMFAISRITCLWKLKK